jgi:predicted nucleotidyltransferase component of viral defense system
VVAQLQEASQREFPGLSIESTRRQSDVTTYVATHADLSVMLQVVGARPEHRAYETGEAAVSLRYSDLQPFVGLLIPSVATFGAMKLGAYEDRRAARDLFDLAELVTISGLTAESLDILKQTRGVGPIKHRYADQLRPTNSEWQTQLGHQTKALGDPKEALEAVKARLVEIGAW